MTVSVLLFARYRDVAGLSAIDVEVPAGATLGQVWEAVQARVPGLRPETRPLLARDLAYRIINVVVA